MSEVIYLKLHITEVSNPGHSFTMFITNIYGACTSNANLTNNYMAVTFQTSKNTILSCSYVIPSPLASKTRHCSSKVCNLSSSTS